MTEKTMTQEEFIEYLQELGYNYESVNNLHFHPICKNMILNVLHTKVQRIIQFDNGNLGHIEYLSLKKRDIFKNPLPDVTANFEMRLKGLYKNLLAFTEVKYPSNISFTLDNIDIHDLIDLINTHYPEF